MSRLHNNATSKRAERTRIHVMSSETDPALCALATGTSQPCIPSLGSSPATRVLMWLTGFGKTGKAA